MAVLELVIQIALELVHLGVVAKAISAAAAYRFEIMDIMAHKMIRYMRDHREQVHLARQPMVQVAIGRLLQTWVKLEPS
jgi:hypothetical protein